MNARILVNLNEQLWKKNFAEKSQNGFSGSAPFSPFPPLISVRIFNHKLESLKNLSFNDLDNISKRGIHSVSISVGGGKNHY